MTTALTERRDGKAIREKKGRGRRYKGDKDMKIGNYFPGRV
jgi:hypothetical protein